MSRFSFLFILTTLIASGVLMASGVKSQNLKEVKVNITNSGSSLRTVLDGMEKQSGFNFYFNEEIGNIPDVVISKKTATMHDVLEEIARSKNLRFKQSGRMIAVTKAPIVQPPQQPGTIRGRIVEFESSEPLAGATIRITGRNQGIQSDENGYYRVSLPAGTYTLEVSYIGFTTTTQRATVGAGRESIVDIKLQGDNTLGEVVVEGRARFSKVPVAFTSERQLLEEVKMSRSVLSGISNEQITRMADRNAAEVIRRISGVSVVDDKFIVVRGMNQRYNLTYLNNNVAPSTELYSRAFAYDMLPAPIIDRIVVYKSPAAELLGDYAGGAVRVYTKNTSPVRALNIGVQVNYREGTTFGDLNGYQGGKTDWSGFDDGTRKMPNIPGFRETGGRQTMTQEQMVNSFSNTWQYGRLQALPDMQLFVNYFDNWRVFGKRLYSMSALTYTNEYRRFGQTQTFRGTGGYASSDETEAPVALITSSAFNDQSTQITKLNLVQNFTYRFNDSHRLEFNNFLLNDARDNTVINNSYDELSGDRGVSTGKMNTFNYQQRFLYNGNLGGVHDLPSALPQNLRWNLGYSRSLQDVPDLRVTNFGRNEEVGSVPEAYQWTAYYRDIQNIYFGLMSRLFIKNTENVYNASADYRINPLPDIELKVGTYQLYRTREMDRRFFKVLPGNFSGNETDQIMQYGGPPAFQNYEGLIRFREQDLAWLWNPRNFAEDGTTLRLFDVSSPLDQYLASEQNNSGYVQGEWAPVDGKLILNAGLRLEYNAQRVIGAEARNVLAGGNSGGDIYYPVPVDLTTTDWLPSINFNYRPDSSWVLRASYGRTVNRPEFREMAPFTDIDFIARERIVGNPNLQRSTIDNYDLRLELYPRRHPNEAISIGAFFKRINQPIERLRYETDWEDALMPEISFTNSPLAHVYGLELDIRKSLAFLPGNLFRNLSVVANGTLVRSRVIKDTDSGRPLQGQAPYVLNGGLFYENPAWGTKLGVIYNVTGSSLYAISTASAERIKAILENGASTPQDQVALQSATSLIEVERHLLDIAFTQRLFSSLQLRVTVQNLLDQPYRLAEDATWDYRYNKPILRIPRTGPNETPRPAYEGDNDMTRYNPGRYYNISFTYAF